MDQVLVNFLGGARVVLGKEFNDPAFGDTTSIANTEAKWRAINKCAHFWFDLEWMPEAQKLWGILANYNSYVLSACPPVEWNPSCSLEKQDWCETNLEISFSQCIVVHNRKDKAKYAKSDGQPNLLIDDHPKNVAEWQLAGGIGVTHFTIPETLSQLTAYGL
jgi:5'(3')-deoxyribonucleotidase